MSLESSALSRWNAKSTKLIARLQRERARLKNASPKFLAASEAAERSLNFLIAADSLLKKGQQSAALEMLDKGRRLHDDFNNVLYDYEADTAEVAEGDITLQGLDREVDFGSAHVAVAQLWNWIYLDLRRPAIVDAAPEEQEPEWSEAKSPQEWADYLGMSSSTLLRRRKDGILVVDVITTKLWRIRLDSLRKLKGGT